MEGYGEFWTEVKAIWTMEYTDYLYDRGGVWNTTLASLMLKPPIDELDDERRNDQAEEEAKDAGEDDDDGTLVDDGLIFDEDGNVVEREAVEDVREMDDDDGPPTFYQLYLMKHVNRFAKAFFPKKKPKVEFSLPGSLADRLDRIPKVPNKHVVRLRRVWLGALRLVGIKKRPRRRPAPKKDFSILQDPRFVAAIVAVLLGQALAGWYVWREIQKEKHD
ncbi:hypothetical protein JL721_3895 [Aureococcus anophagefferens]|nr:hypothetical protein JL721_3895 [Aureococcus anophagefferens]